MAEANIVVLGAGVIGLTTAMLLSENPSYKVTLVAKHMPGDYDIEYASPWAGADYMPVGKPGTRLEQFEKDTWPEFNDLAKNIVDAGIHFQDSVLYNRKKEADSPEQRERIQQRLKPWYQEVMPNFRTLSKKDLPPGADSGTAYTSVCINTAIYLPWLAGQCVKNGTKLRRGVVSHITNAATLHHSGKTADVVINCTGLSARHLGGVMDQTVYPVRGQIVVVRNEPNHIASLSGTDDGPDESTYVMQRAMGGGTILGGCSQKNNWESQPDPNLAIRIMKRCVEWVPELTSGAGIEKLSIIRHGVGLRPMRDEGPRVEKEKIGGVWVVHQYGHGGCGYQSSYGSAFEACRLAEGVLKEKARL